MAGSESDNGKEQGEGGRSREAGGARPPRAKSGRRKSWSNFPPAFRKPFIQRPVMTMLLTASIIVFGILTYNQLAVNDLPAVDYPVIRVSASYPGANPETMANTIATPLEKQFTQIPGLELIHEHELAGQHPDHSPVRSRKGIDAAATDVQSAIQRASGQLPNDLPARPLSPRPIRTISRSCTSP